MEPSAEILQWLRREIKEIEDDIRLLENQRRKLEGEIQAFRKIEARYSPEAKSVSFTFEAGPTFLTYGAINIPVSHSDHVGEGRAALRFEDLDYAVGVSRKQNANNSPRVNASAELKALFKDKLALGDRLECRIDAPLQFRIRRLPPEAVADMVVELNRDGLQIKIDGKTHRLSLLDANNLRERLRSDEHRKADRICELERVFSLEDAIRLREAIDRLVMF